MAQINGPQAGQQKIKKREAVRRAMARLGDDARPADIQSFIKREFNVDMSIDHIYNCRSEIRKQNKRGGPRKPGPKKGTARIASTAPPPAPVPVAAPARQVSPAPARKEAEDGLSINASLRDIEAVKDLVGRVGPQQLRALIDLFAK
jgi:hypothetical protein